MIGLKDLLFLMSDYSDNEKNLVIKAYDYAEKLHSGQLRESGEPYVTHPLNVAYILAEMHADVDTVCAALLHDTLEDTEITKEEIASDFNADTANLVDGVTKISKMNFSTKQEQNMANTRKIITSLTTDVRIVIIKLADRLHNMRTLEHKKEVKQKENALETLEIFVPLAYLLGSYRIKSELEDISFKYLKPDIYKRLEEKKLITEADYKDDLDEMLFKIKSVLEENDIINTIKLRTKNIYGIYKNSSNNKKITDIHDLFAFKIMVEDIKKCYTTLCLIHSLYKPINYMFKDFICNPKTNMYSSLHTTVFGPKGKLIQTQIRTDEMDKIASFGLTAYWNLNQEDARDKMQDDLKNKYQFFDSLLEINKFFGDNYEFVTQVKKELLSKNIYVYNSNGDIVELPYGSSPIDFAYKLGENVGNSMTGIYVNEEFYSIDALLKMNIVLNNKDVIRVITDDLSFGPNMEWYDKANTTYAKRKIIEYNNI